MNTQTYHDLILPAALKFFPANYSSKEARAEILTIGLQESDFVHRQQLIGSKAHWWLSINGPATGFQQFELVGVTEVLRNPATRQRALYVCDLFGYPPEPSVIHKALVHNDLLGAVWSRLALWRVREPLAKENNPEEGWRQYIQIWAPGKAKPLKWLACWEEAWRVVNKYDKT